MIRTNRSSNAPKEAPLLHVEHLRTYFPIRRGILQRVTDYVKAVDDVSFHINEG
ncbi:MAG: peptide ABC transporter substrate-binding protein, partial [Planctomycetota bacterium]|nr:peptide ABC transporter substrate-binding protein [Planctomycetota bacterium]